MLNGTSGYGTIRLASMDPISSKRSVGRKFGCTLRTASINWRRSIVRSPLLALPDQEGVRCLRSPERRAPTHRSLRRPSTGANNGILRHQSSCFITSTCFTMDQHNQLSNSLVNRFRSISL